MSQELYDKVRLAREGSAVERCHCHPHLMRYSVGHHSLDMVTLITLCWAHDHGGRIPRAELLIAAAFHDVPERIVGDVPQPVKVLLGGRLDEAEDRVLAWLGVDHVLDPEETLWLNAADRVELYLWSMEEAFARGNVYFERWAEDYRLHFTKNPPPASLARVMEWASRFPGQRLGFETLKEIAGL